MHVRVSSVFKCKQTECHGHFANIRGVIIYSTSAVLKMPVRLSAFTQNKFDK